MLVSKGRMKALRKAEVATSTAGFLARSTLHKEEYKRKRKMIL
jgi:hypothetical protein